MWDVTHAAVALAVMTAIPGVARRAEQGDPVPVLLGVACALLPNILERTRRRLCPADVTVALDPLAPAAEDIAECIAVAAHQCYAGQIVRTARLLPLPARSAMTRDGGGPWVRFDGFDRRVRAALAPGAAEAERPLPPMHPGWPCLHGLSALDGLLLRFTPGSATDPRVRCQPMERGWPHGPALLAAVAVAAFALLDAMTALCVLAAVASHDLLDQGGLAGVAWSRPSKRAVGPPGWRLWRECSVVANASATWLAGLATFWNLVRATDYLPWRPTLITLLFCGYAAPWLAFRIARRLQTGEPAGTGGSHASLRS